MNGKAIILSAPSGAGKTTIMRRVTETFPELEFSVSATSRAPRGEERHGVEYYFLSPDEFRACIAAGDFVEWEEVYGGSHYGTLRRELERIETAGHTVIFDIDVRGGVNLKQKFGADALSIFIMPPSLEVLRERLTGRGTDSPEAIEKRLSKAREELSFAPQFDIVVTNEKLDTAVAQVEDAIREFLKR